MPKSPSGTSSWTKKELKHYFGVGYGTLQKWLSKIPNFLSPDELKRKKKFSPAEASIVFDHIGTNEE